MSETKSRGPGRPPGQAAEKSNLVKRVREAMELRQVDFAEKLGCSLPSVRRFEQFEVLPVNHFVLKRLHDLAKKAGIEI